MIGCLLKLQNYDLYIYFYLVWGELGDMVDLGTYNLATNNFQTVVGIWVQC